MDLNQSQKIISFFLPKAKVKQIQIHNQGLINQTFIVLIERNKILERYILQSINKTIFNNHELNLLNIIEVKKVISESSFPYELPTPVESKYLNIFNQTWRIIPFVEKSICFENVTNIKLAFEAAVCLGSFYNVLHDFDLNKLHESIPGFHNGSKRLEEFEQSIYLSEKIRKNRCLTLIESIKKEKDVIKKFDNLNTILPKRVCHFDTKISNFLFDINTNKAKAIIDLDTLMPGTVLSDIGDMIRNFSNLNGEESTDFENIRAEPKVIRLIISGFLKHASKRLTKMEQDNLVFAGQAITLIQCIRFLTDFLNNDIYFKTFYENHNMNRAENQWRLYTSLKDSTYENYSY